MNNAHLEDEIYMAIRRTGYATRDQSSECAENVMKIALISSANELLQMLIESQESIGGDWRERRDALISKATGGAK